MAPKPNSPALRAPMKIRKRGGGSYTISGDHAAKMRKAFWMKLSAQNAYKQDATKADSAASTKLLTSTRKQRVDRGLPSNRKRAETTRNSWIEAQKKGGFSVKASNTGVKVGKKRKSGETVGSRLKSGFVGKQEMRSKPEATGKPLSMKSKAFKADVKKAGALATRQAASKKLKGSAKQSFIGKRSGSAGVAAAAKVAQARGRGGKVAQAMPPKLAAAKRLKGKKRK